MEQDIHQLIGFNIRRVRKAKGITAPQLAEKVSLNIMTIYGYESNKQKINFETLKVVADALEVHMNDLLDESLDVKPLKKVVTYDGVDSVTLYGNVAKNIKEQRIRRGWSQPELGRRIFVTRYSVSLWELNRSKMPLDVLVRIADVMGEPITTFIS